MYNIVCTSQVARKQQIDCKVHEDLALTRKFVQSGTRAMADSTKQARARASGCYGDDGSILYVDTMRVGASFVALSQQAGA